MNSDWQWVTVKRFSEISGYTPKAIYIKIQRGVWISDIHFRKAPDGRIFLDCAALQSWIKGEAA